MWQKIRVPTWHGRGFGKGGEGGEEGEGGEGGEEGEGGEGGEEGEEGEGGEELSKYCIMGPEPSVSKRKYQN